MDEWMPSFRVVGPGRAGTSLARALSAAGWDLAGLLGRGDDVSAAAAGVDLLVLAVPYGVIAAVAAAVEPVETTVVAHLAGSLGLDALAPHVHRAAVHPLVALPDGDVGAGRLTAGAWFAVAGDPTATAIVEALGGRSFTIADADRPLYHAAAVVASNHLVGLLGQAQRVAALAGAPFEAYLDLVRGTVENVTSLGPAAALTGPAARGDEDTIRRHLAALPEDERPGYEAMVELCRRLAAR